VGKEVAQFLKWLGWIVNLEKFYLTPSRTWRYLGFQNIIGPFTGRMKEKSVRFVKRSAEKDSSKSMDNESRSSEVDWSIICSQTPIPASKFILGEAKPDENRFGQEVRLERKDLHKPQCDGKNPRVDSMDKENPSFHLQKPSPPQAIITRDAAPTWWRATLTFTKHSNFLNRLPPTRINNISFRQYQSEPAAEPVIAHGQWTKTMSTQSSNRREFVGIHVDVREFFPLLKEKGCYLFRQYDGNIQYKQKSSVEEPSPKPSEALSLCTESRYYSTGTSHSRGGEQGDGFT
jgi:hypothetical protein